MYHKSVFLGSLHDDHLFGILTGEDVLSYI